VGYQITDTSFYAQTGVERIMFEGNTANLQMLNPLIVDAKLEKTVYRCKVLKYEEGSEEIYLSLENGVLQNILLDAVYECRIAAQPEGVACKGIIKERCLNEQGSILHLKIEAGFYEINIK